MFTYPKKVMSIAELVENCKAAQLTITSDEEAAELFMKIGFYRLRGYAYQFYDKQTKTYKSGTTLDQILQIYRFDKELSHLIFRFITEIEVALRANLINALLGKYDDALILYEPAIFFDKNLFWKNMSKISSEIVRSNDPFIMHNYENYDGQIPLWAVGEVFSFGGLSKIIENFNRGAKSSYFIFSLQYSFVSSNGAHVNPTQSVLSSWVQATVVLRNRCAHNSRIYNRSINVAPVLLDADKTHSTSRYNGLYHNLMALKYLRPDDKSWETFADELSRIIASYEPYINLKRLSFPEDWRTHMQLNCGM